MRMTPRFYPRLKLYRRPVPAHPPMLLDAMSDELFAQTKIGPAVQSGVLWTDLKKDGNIDFDGTPGLPRKWKPLALTLGYSLEWLPTTRTEWIHRPTQAEVDVLNHWHKIYLDELDRLDAVKEPSDEQTEQIRAFEYLVAQAENYQLMARTQYNAMGTKTSGLWWACAVPNVPVTFKSAFQLKKGRAVSFRLLRAQAPDGQARHSFTIELGNGNTLYALVIGEDGNSASFIHYRNMSERARDALFAELSGILDRGRLTAADQKELDGWDNRLQQMEYVKKQRGKGENKYTEGEAAEIKQIKADAKALRASKKGLTEAEKNRKLEIEHDLYLARETLFLQEEAQGMIGVPIDITFKFLRTGFVVIDSNDNRFVYENKRITGAKPPQYTDGLPKGSFVRLKSDGGQFSIAYGHPKYLNRGEVKTQPFSVPFEFDMEAVRFDYEGVAPAGTQIAMSLTKKHDPGKPGKVPLPPTYQAVIEMTSLGDEVFAPGENTPELYLLDIHIPGGEVPGFDEPLWDSQAHGANLSANSGNRLMDLLVQDDERRSRQASVFIDNAGGGANLPKLAAGLVADAQLLDRETDTLVNVVSKGKVADIEHGRSLLWDSGFIVVADAGHNAKINIVGPENFLNKEITARIGGHDQYPTDYLIDLAHDAGLHPSQYASIPTGESARFARIPRPQPGTYPDCKPSPGTTYLEWMQEIAKKYCKGTTLGSDNTGLALRAAVTRDRPELTYGTPATGVTVDSHLCLRNEISLRQDVRDYVTSVTAVGALNPLTGIRYSATETIPQANVPGFEDSMYWIADEIHLQLPTDDALQTDVACLKRAREELRLRGRPPWYAALELDFDPSLSCGDVPRVFGLPMAVESVEFGALAAGDMRERNRLEVRLTEDVSL